MAAKAEKPAAKPMAKALVSAKKQSQGLFKKSVAKAAPVSKLKKK